ncbi:hypothetical protein [Nannocystis pusilla]|uniref:hypothetical protein n=1 Tax=Nannocystis pusilla TaxID=889268 RepID=UPI003B8164C6
MMEPLPAVAHAGRVVRSGDADVAVTIDFMSEEAWVPDEAVIQAAGLAVVGC